VGLAVFSAAVFPLLTTPLVGVAADDAVVGGRPNLLLFLTDDQRADHLGCAGHPFLKTPVVDRLAAEGVRFENAFVTTAICAASRASLLTATREGTHGYTFGEPPVSAELAASAYPRLLRSAGYRTGFVGKWGVRLAAGARGELFDRYRPLERTPYFKPQADGVERHLTELAADEAIAFLDEVEPATPFCLTVSFHAPHAEDSDPRQYFWPPAQDGLYETSPIPPASLSRPSDFEALPRFLRESLGRERWGWRFDSTSKREAMVRGYCRMITGVDAAVGRVLAALERLGRAGETVVLFTSDNGAFLGERGLAGKWLIYEESIRVPLVLFDPRADRERRGIVESATVLNLDLAPTLLDLAGVQAPATYQGRSLQELLDGEGAGWRRDFLYEHRFDHPTIPVSEGVRDDRWTYARYPGESPPAEQLFDRREDPLEERDLAADPDHAGVLARLRARCDELLAGP
jgi:arylsulfatase A-like enzyme